MAIYNKNGETLISAYSVSGASLQKAYNINGTEVYNAEEPTPDYTNYTFTQKWASKGVANAQGFDIYDEKVFWVSKSGDSTVPSNCYVWNLSDGTQALNTAYITVYSGHGNKLSFSKNGGALIATPAYPPSRVFINTVGQGYSMTLNKVLVLNDGSTDCDACYDPNDSTIMLSLGHTANSSDRSAPYKISKWDLTDLTDNGDGTYTPNCLKTVTVAQPANSYFFQGCKFHDGILWFANGYTGGNVNAYVFGVNPDTGEYIYTIDCETTAEPEGLSWYPDNTAVGGYALYVGFAGMMLRKYTFAEAS